MRSNTYISRSIIAKAPRDDPTPRSRARVDGSHSPIRHAVLLEQVDRRFGAAHHPKHAGIPSHLLPQHQALLDDPRHEPQIPARIHHLSLTARAHGVRLERLALSLQAGPHVRLAGEEGRITDGEIQPVEIEVPQRDDGIAVDRLQHPGARDEVVEREVAHRGSEALLIHVRGAHAPAGARPQAEQRVDGRRAGADVQADYFALGVVAGRVARCGGVDERLDPGYVVPPIGDRGAEPVAWELEVEAEIFSQDGLGEGLDGGWVLEVQVAAAFVPYFAELFVYLR